MLSETFSQNRQTRPHSHIPHHSPHRAADAAHKCQVAIFAPALCETSQNKFPRPMCEGQVRSGVMTVLSVCEDSLKTVIHLHSRMSLHKHKAGK